MITIKKIFVSISLLFVIACNGNVSAMALSQFDYGAASVFPVYTFNGKKYGILAREAHGPDVGTYDDFGGKKDPGEMHPFVSAAREWMEEGLVKYITGLTLDEIRKFIDLATPKNKKKVEHTECIVAYTGRKAKNVAYITDVAQYKNDLIYKFYGALRRLPKGAKHAKYREKDRIAVVDLAELTRVLQDEMIKDQHKVIGITMSALVLNPKTNKLEKDVITLRPFFVSKIRPYFLNWPYQEGKNPKIRFYAFNKRPSVKQVPLIKQALLVQQVPPAQQIVPAKQSWGNWLKAFVVKKPVVNKAVITVTTQKD